MGHLRNRLIRETPPPTDITDEPLVNYDNLVEPDAELLSGSEIDPFADAEIENRVAAVEMRDAQNFSARTDSSAAKRRSRHSNSKSAKRKSGKRTSDSDGEAATMMAAVRSSVAVDSAPCAPVSS